MSALTDAMRKKYRTPQEAIEALGLDAALVTDPPVSEAQRRAMYAAAEGKSNLGIPKKVGEEFVGSKAKDAKMTKEKAEDKKMGKDKFPKSAMDWLKGNMDAKAWDEFCAKDEWPDEDAMDESEEEAEKEFEAKDKKAKDKAMDKKAMDKKAKDKAMDKKAKDSEEEESEEVNEGKKDVKQEAEDKAKDKAMDKHAMDAALKVVREETEKSVHGRMKSLFEAAKEVKPYIGEIDPMAFDSGEAIQRHALKALGRKDADTLPSGALSTILELLPKAGARPVDRQRSTEMAMDQSTRAGAVALAPGLSRITIGV